MSTRPLIAAALLCLPAVLVRADDQPGHRDQPHPLQVGALAPAFGPLPVVNRKAAGLSELAFKGRPEDKDHVWVVSFFATWCPGCVNEMPMLNKLGDSYKGKGVRVVSISVDQSKDADGHLTAFLGKSHFKHPVAVDADQTVLRLYENGAQSLPYIFVIGPDGKIAATHEGFDEKTEPELRTRIDALLSATG